MDTTFVPWLWTSVNRRDLAAIISATGAKDAEWRITTCMTALRASLYIPTFARGLFGARGCLQLHVGYEKIEPWPTTRTDDPDKKTREAGVLPKVLLKADKDAGLIRTLSNIPVSVFAYLIVSRSGIEWVLEQYKEKTPKDQAIRERFNTYRFADYKEKIIDLIARVTRVSVETMEIVDAMESVGRVSSVRDHVIKLPTFTFLIKRFCETLYSITKH